MTKENEYAQNSISLANLKFGKDYVNAKKMEVGTDRDLFVSMCDNYLEDLREFGKLEIKSPLLRSGLMKTLTEKEDEIEGLQNFLHERKML